ncbi:MAG: RrF2 family transcriptional regulator [Pseudorhodobacter sp.]
MRLTTRSNLAMRTLMYCAANPGRTVRKQDVARACNASENHLAQVIHKLARHGVLATVRGRSGGLRLAHPPEDIRIGRVIRALESTVPFTQCMAAEVSECPLRDCCRLRCVFAEALEAFYATLDRVTLRDLVSGNDDLMKLLRAA